MKSFIFPSKAKASRASNIAQPVSQLTKSIVDNRPLAVMQRKLQSLANSKGVLQAKMAHGGLPDDLKMGLESLSGVSLDGVKVHYNSSKPAEVGALAYAQGNDIYLAPGQEKHLAHEAWHVIQQKQGRVQPTLQLNNGAAINDNVGLEMEADRMGQRSQYALQRVKAVGTGFVDNRVSTVKQRQLQVTLNSSRARMSNVRGVMQLQRDATDQDKLQLEELVTQFAVPEDVITLNFYIVKLLDYYEKLAGEKSKQIFKNLKDDLNDFDTQLINTVKGIHPNLRNVGAATQQLEILIKSTNPKNKDRTSKEYCFDIMQLDGYKNIRDELFFELKRLAAIKTFITQKFNEVHKQNQNEGHARGNTSSITKISNNQLTDDQKKEILDWIRKNNNTVTIRPTKLLDIIIGKNKFSIKIHYDLIGPPHGTTGTPHAQIVKEEAKINGSPTTAITPLTMAMDWNVIQEVLKYQSYPAEIVRLAEDHIKGLGIAKEIDVDDISALANPIYPTKMADSSGAVDTDGYKQFYHVKHGDGTDHLEYVFNSGHGYRKGHASGEDITDLGLDSIAIEMSIMKKLSSLTLKAYKETQGSVEVVSPKRNNSKVKISFRYTLSKKDSVNISTYFIDK